MGRRLEYEVKTSVRLNMNNRRLRISLVTLNDWVNRGRIRAHKIGGRVLFRDSDVEAALHRIVPIKSR